MLSEAQRKFLTCFADLGASDVEQALIDSGTLSEDYRQMCNDDDFRRALWELFASLEVAPAPDPFCPPETLAPTVVYVEGIMFAATDPYGPLYQGSAYEFTSRSFAFADGTKMSALQPASVTWFSTLCAWKLVDKAVRDAADAAAG